MLCVELWPCITQTCSQNLFTKKVYASILVWSRVYVCALHGSAELWTPIMSVSTLPELVTVRIIQTSSEQHQLFLLCFQLLCIEVLHRASFSEFFLLTYLHL